MSGGRELGENEPRLTQESQSRAHGPRASRWQENRGHWEVGEREAALTGRGCDLVCAQTQDPGHLSPATRQVGGTAG